MLSSRCRSVWDRTAIREFVTTEVVPFAADWDRAGAVPRERINVLARAGLLGLLLPEDIGGGGASMGTLAIVHEEVGRACSSMRSVLTVHAMVAHAVQRWGGTSLRARYAHALAEGSCLGAFALSEPTGGSDPAEMQTTVDDDGDGYVLNGRKTWITLGQYADVVLVFARAAGGPLALLVDRDTPGLTVEPIGHMIGTRAALLASLEFAECRVNASARLGHAGFGLGVAQSALEIGRLSVAAGCVGVQQACLDASLAYTRERRSGGRALAERPLVLAMLTELATNLRASRALCEIAARSYDERSPSAGHDIHVAKYFASRAATQAANDAVQLHGANGLSTSFGLERLLRDAKVTEIIEAPTQVLQTLIAEREFALAERAGFDGA